MAKLKKKGGGGGVHSNYFCPALGFLSFGQFCDYRIQTIKSCKLVTNRGATRENKLGNLAQGKYWVLYQNIGFVKNRKSINTR